MSSQGGDLGYGEALDMWGFSVVLVVCEVEQVWSSSITVSVRLPWFYLSSMAIRYLGFYLSSSTIGLLFLVGVFVWVPLCRLSGG